MLELVIDQRRRDLGGFEVGCVLLARQAAAWWARSLFFDHMGPVGRLPLALPRRSMCGPIPISGFRR